MAHCVAPVSRLFAHSKNYDMDMTLDYNIELFPLRENESFAMALASSLARGPGQTADGEDEKDKDVWRPDGKGRRGLEEDYDYVMYGKVSNLALFAPPLDINLFSCEPVLKRPAFRCTSLTAALPRPCASCAQIAEGTLLTLLSLALHTRLLGVCSWP
jgi:hypothetical protein